MNSSVDHAPSPIGHAQPAPASPAVEERFRHLIEAAADGVLVVRSDGTIGFANPAAAGLMGRPADDLVGRAFGIPIVPGETTEIDISRPDGQVRIAEMRASSALWQDQPSHLATLRDVTERRRAEEALREADRRKDEFLAMLAHELRNPLAVISNAVQLARRSEAESHRRWSQEVIDHQCKHLARLVDDLLDVSRITRGQIALRPARLDMTPLIDAVVEAIRPLVDEREHTLAVSRPPWPLWVDADATRLEQVLVNLLSNAAKYTGPGGRIGLAVGIEGDEVVIRVEDDGVGIAPEVLPKMFDLFAQGDRSLARSEGGLGIGLTLARTLVEMHGGSLTAASAGLGRGSEFVVRLPASRPPGPPGPRPPSPGTAAARPPAHILIVDDNVETALGLSALLELDGHRVRMVHDGPSALETARADRPEIILLDIGLPGIDGYEVARRLRAEDWGHGCTIIAISGYGQESDRRRSREAGMDHHLIKPIAIEALMQLIAQAPTTQG